MLAQMILAPAAHQSGEARPQPPPPPPAAEHHYNPGSRTVHTTYTCMDGARSVTLQYEQVPKGRVTSMSRNNRLASPKVVEEVNRLIGRFAQIAGVYPQCGRTDDSLFVSGFVGKQRMTMWIAWSDTTVHLLAAERPDQ